MATTDEVRQIAREEIASLCGLILRRLDGDSDLDEVRAAFGEALRDFGATTDEPGQPA